MILTLLSNMVSHDEVRMYFIYSTMLQIKDLRVGQWKEPCIEFTQENLIESSVQDCLSLYYSTIVCTTISTAYPKDYVFTLRFTCYMTSFLEPSMLFYMYCDFVTMSYDVTDVWQCNLHHSNPNPKFKNRKINK